MHHKFFRFAGLQNAHHVRELGNSAINVLVPDKPTTYDVRHYTIVVLSHPVERN